ncbi:MAG: twin-arginine translocase subunit TatC [Bacillota bacterium]
MDTELKQALSEHIAELRKTLILSVVTLLAFFVLIFLLFDDPLVDFFLKDIRNLGLSVVYTTIAEVWTTKIKVAFIAAFVAAFPFISFYFWRFLAPALYRHERRIIGACFFASLFLFILGVAFAYFVVLPFTLRFFVTFGMDTADAMLTISRYVSFLMAFIVPFGLVFQMPMAVYLLTKLGLIGPALLVKTRKYVIVLLLILAAVLTPPDVVSQLLLFFPMMILWEISVAVAKRTTPLREKTEE